MCSVCFRTTYSQPAIQMKEETLFWNCPSTQLVISVKIFCPFAFFVFPWCRSFFWFSLTVISCVWLITLCDFFFQSRISQKHIISSGISLVACYIPLILWKLFQMAFHMRTLQMTRPLQFLFHNSIQTILCTSLFWHSDPKSASGVTVAVRHP